MREGLGLLARNYLFLEKLVTCQTNERGHVTPLRLKNASNFTPPQHKIHKILGGKL